MIYTVIWYGKQAEKDAKDHAQASFAARRHDDGVVAVEVRKHDGTVVFSQAGGGMDSGG